jgi:hypothetical protein
MMMACKQVALPTTWIYALWRHVLLLVAAMPCRLTSFSNTTCHRIWQRAAFFEVASHWQPATIIPACNMPDFQTLEPTSVQPGMLNATALIHEPGWCHTIE